MALVALVPSGRPLAEVRALSELKGVYVPFWTFDAATHSAWTADAGYDYQVAVQVVENGQTHTRYETRTRWEPAEGVLEHFFDDLPVAASRGLPSDLARAIEPFPTADLLAYEASYLSGFLAEEYAVGPKEALDVGAATHDGGALRGLRPRGSGRPVPQPPGPDGLVAASRARTASSPSGSRRTSTPESRSASS